MPEISTFVKELLEEDIFGEEYYNRINNRVRALNVSQLNAMHKHLKKTTNKSKFQIWKDANADIENHYGDCLREKVLEVQLNEKNKTKLIYKIEIKKKLKNDMKGEAERVKNFIEKNSMDVATTEVMDTEKERQVITTLYS
jgi:hypothetical protein